MLEENHLLLKLPSRCLVYHDIDPSTLGIRVLKGKDQMIIAETTYDNFDRKLTLVLNNVVKGIKAEDLTIGDRLYVLLWLVINSRKKSYMLDVSCKYCWIKNEVEVDLSKIEVFELPEGFKEPYSIQLSSGKMLGLRLFRVKDEIDIADYEKKGKSAWIYRWARSIVDEKTTIIDKIQMLEDLDVVDLNKIRAFHEKFSHGPKMEIKHVCKECGGEGIVPVPFRLEMLFPFGEELIRSFGDEVPVDVPPTRFTRRYSSDGHTGDRLDVQQVSQGKDG